MAGYRTLTRRARPLSIKLSRGRKVVGGYYSGAACEQEEWKRRRGDSLGNGRCEEMRGNPGVCRVARSGAGREKGVGVLPPALLMGPCRWRGMVS